MNAHEKTYERRKIEAELMQAKADYVANVPGSWDRYQKCQDEFVMVVCSM